MRRSDSPAPARLLPDEAGAEAKKRRINPYERLRGDVYSAIYTLFGKLRERREIRAMHAPDVCVAINTAEALGFVVVAESDGNVVRFYARPAVDLQGIPYSVRPYQIGGEKL